MIFIVYGISYRHVLDTVCAATSFNLTVQAFGEIITIYIASFVVIDVVAGKEEVTAVDSRIGLLIAFVFVAKEMRLVFGLNSNQPFPYQAKFVHVIAWLLGLSP